MFCGTLAPLVFYLPFSDPDEAAQLLVKIFLAGHLNGLYTLIYSGVQATKMQLHFNRTEMCV